MSIRLFMALLLSGVFMLAAGIIATSDALLTERLQPILAQAGFPELLQESLMLSSLVSLALAALLILLVFFVVGHLIARPMRNLTKAMDAFTDKGERIELSKGWAPKEVDILLREFSDLTQKVEDVHAHDMEVSRIKTDFISTAAHQLRTPLTGIRWALEALQMEQLTEHQKSLVTDATEKSKQLVSVVGTLLDISSIESGKYRYTFAPESLDAIVEETVHDFIQAAQEAKVTLLFEKSGQPSATVNVDKERIRWILNNLIENAIRYTPEGGMVRVTTEQSTGRALVRVRDTGIGIAQEDKANIFQRFYRAQNAITKQNGGSGLGLYIARTIAQDHQGDLSFADNDQGMGTTFTLWLPVA